MTPAEVAADYRRRGRYDLALAAAKADASPGGRIEEARALVRLGRAGAALGVLATLEDPAAPAPGLAPGDTPRDPLESPPEDEAWSADLSLDYASARGEARLADGDARGARADFADALTRAEALGPPPSLAVARAIDALASAQLVLGEIPDGLGLAARAVAMGEVLAAPGDEQAQLLATLAEAHHRAGQWAAAADVWRQALALRRAFDPEHPDVAATLDGLGNTLRRNGELRRALAAHREALPLHRARLGTIHPALAACHHALAQALHRSGEFAAARTELERALAISERHPGEDHPDTWVTRFELGRMEVDTGEVERGFARMEGARRRLVALIGADHPTVKAMARWL